MLLFGRLLGEFVPLYEISSSEYMPSFQTPIGNSNIMIEIKNVSSYKKEFKFHSQIPALQKKEIANCSQSISELVFTGFEYQDLKQK